MDILAKVLTNYFFSSWFESVDRELIKVFQGWVDNPFDLTLFTNPNISLHGPTIVSRQSGHPIGIQLQIRGDSLYQISRRLSIVLYVLHECY